MKSENKNLYGKRITGKDTCEGCGYTRVQINEDGYCGHCEKSYIEDQIEDERAFFEREKANEQAYEDRGNEDGCPYEAL